MTKKSTIYKNKFEESGILTDLLAYLSTHTWEKLKFSSMQSSEYSKIYETDISNFLVSEIAEATLEHPLPIRLFHSKKESVNGNDFEVIIPIATNQYILFPCQAKRLYVANEQNNNFDAQYEALGHVTGSAKTLQILSLLNYAKKNYGFPLYLFWYF